MIKFYKLIAPVALIIIGIIFIKDHFSENQGSKERISQLEQLISEGQQTDGLRKNEYSEKTIKIAKIPVKHYHVEYTFSLNEKEFTGKENLKEPPAQQEVTVTYLGENPAINAVEPEQELSKLQEQQESSNGLYLGLGAIALGGFFGFSRYKTLAKPKTI